MIVNADFKALEWVVVCDLANEKVGIKEYVDFLEGRESEDQHTKNQRILNLPDRREAKIFLFR